MTESKSARALVAASMAVTIGLFGHVATAEAATLSELQQQVEQSNSAYEEATQEVERIQADIDANEQRIAELEQQLPAQRQRAAESIRTLYKMQQGTPGLVEFILAADDFNDFLACVTYLDSVTTHNNKELEALIAMDQELDQNREDLARNLTDAQDKQATAQAALDEAIAARTELEAQIAAEQEAERQAQEAAIQAAAAAAAAAQEATATDDGSTSGSFTTESGNSATVEVPQTDTVPSVDWQSSKDTFVAGWGTRIDNYLAGSPLAGHGTTFAETAWAYGVDPRFSPAISCIESGKGTYCFRPHNAWGWGSASWSDWDTAIWAHTAGLANGYGGHLTVAGAKKYCPPNWQFWYSSVAAQMERI